MVQTFIFLSSLTHRKSFCGDSVQLNLLGSFHSKLMQVLNALLVAKGQKLNAASNFQNFLEGMNTFCRT